MSYDFCQLGSHVSMCLQPGVSLQGGLCSFGVPEAHLAGRHADACFVEARLRLHTTLRLFLDG